MKCPPCVRASGTACIRPSVRAYISVTTGRIHFIFEMCTYYKFLTVTPHVEAVASFPVWLCNLIGLEVSGRYLLNRCMDFLHIRTVASSYSPAELIYIPRRLTYFCTRGATYSYLIWSTKMFLTIFGWTTWWIYFIFALWLHFSNLQNSFA